jgi:hypothetical protein
LAIADSGIIVSWDVDTAEPVEALVLPLAAIEFVARLRAESLAIAAEPAFALAAPMRLVVGAANVPATAFVDWEPLALPPDVLM